MLPLASLLAAACALSSGSRSVAAPRCATSMSAAPTPVFSEIAAMPLAYDLLQGADVDWMPGPSRSGPAPPTCLLVHGILGSRRNLQSFGQRLVKEFPAWQCVLVDLRCHGQSAGVPREGSNTVSSAAADVVALLTFLKLYPTILIGHSFGGKVVMALVLEYLATSREGSEKCTLPRPVQIWVLDTVPGDVFVEEGDHPRDTIDFVSKLPVPFASRKSLTDALTGAGFTPEGAQWMATNLKPRRDGQLAWSFDLPGIAEMYASYEATSLWHMLETTPRGLSVDFVRAERSAFVWSDADLARIAATGAVVHPLPDSSHWVHIDNPEGLLEILAPCFRRQGAKQPVNFKR